MPAECIDLMKFFQAQELVYPCEHFLGLPPENSKQQTNTICFHSKVTLTHIIVCSEVCKKTPYIEELDLAPSQMKFILHC